MTIKSPYFCTNETWRDFLFVLQERNISMLKLTASISGNGQEFRNSICDILGGLKKDCRCKYFTFLALWFFQSPIANFPTIWN